MKSARHVWSLFLFFLAFAFIFPRTIPALADLSGCSASVNQSSVSPSSTNGFTISFSNTSDTQIQYIKISRPSANFTIDSHTIGGWTVDQNSSDITLTGSMDPNGSSTFDFTVTTGGSEASAANWSVIAADNTDGTGAISCTGSLGTTISSTPPDTTAPEISSDITISDVADTTAKLSWTTDEAASSTLYYGTTTDYSNTATDTSGTSHAITLSGLTANTTYHFSIQSTDSTGNSSDSSDATFATSVTNRTVTVTTTTTTTTTTVVTGTPKPTPTPDKTPPYVTVSTDFSEPFEKFPTVKGLATDISGVGPIEYSADDGTNWLPVDRILSPGAKSTSFEFTSDIFDDGTYSLKIRATDGLGNRGNSRGFKVIIDRLPPKIGAGLYTVGPIVLPVNRDGQITAQTGLPVKLTVSAVGGPTQIQLSDPGNLNKLDSLKFNKNPETGLWSQTFTFDEPGMFDLKVNSADGARNSAYQVLPGLKVLPRGKITDGQSPVVGAILDVYYFDPLTQNYLPWDGTAYSQISPIKTDEKGEFSLLLPSGKYYLLVRASGFKTVKTAIFSLTQPFPVSEEIIMDKAWGINIGNLFLGFPEIFSKTFGLTLKNEKTVNNSTLVGSQFPQIILNLNRDKMPINSLNGKPALITVLNSWSPQTPVQMVELERFSQAEPNLNVAVILEQESATVSQLYARRGGYKIPVFADPDGELVDPLKIRTLPVHFLLNRSGVIQKEIKGVLNERDLLDNLNK